jgi:glutamine cyclotransferase
MKVWTWLGALALCALAGSVGAAAAVPEYGYRVVHAYPHDRTAFTEGLFFQDGALYESTGLEGRSSIRKEVLETGQVLQSRTVPPQYFGEGVVAWKGRLIELTWQNQIGFVYDLKTLEPFAAFHYAGEGWALTKDDHRLIMSDGTDVLRFLDPDTLAQIGQVHVTDEGRPVTQINELEYVKGQVFANIWQTNRIARIDPATGKVVGWIDLTGLLSDADRAGAPVDVLNGIAYDAKTDRLFVTGKLWPKLYEIKLVPKTASAPKSTPGKRRRPA